MSYWRNALEIKISKMFHVFFEPSSKLRHSFLDKSMLLISHAGKKIMNRQISWLWAHDCISAMSSTTCWLQSLYELALKVRKGMEENGGSMRWTDSTSMFEWI